MYNNNNCSNWTVFWRKKLARATWLQLPGSVTPEPGRSGRSCCVCTRAPSAACPPPWVWQGHWAWPQLPVTQASLITTPPRAWAAWLAGESALGQKRQRRCRLGKSWQLKVRLPVPLPAPSPSTPSPHRDGIELTGSGKQQGKTFWVLLPLLEGDGFENRIIFLFSGIYFKTPVKASVKLADIIS